MGTWASMVVAPTCITFRVTTRSGSRHLGFVLRRTLLQQASTIHLLEDGLLHMLDNNFAISLPSENAKNSAKILSLFNQVTDKLRVERQHIFQRELLLDKVVNESSVVTVLVNHNDIIVFANHAAKQWFEPSSKAMIGANWTPLFQEITPRFLSAA